MSRRVLHIVVYGQKSLMLLLFPVLYLKDERMHSLKLRDMHTIIKVERVQTGGNSMHAGGMRFQRSAESAVIYIPGACDAYARRYSSCFLSDHAIRQMHLM